MRNKVRRDIQAKSSFGLDQVMTSTMIKDLLVHPVANALKKILWVVFYWYKKLSHHTEVDLSEGHFVNFELHKNGVIFHEKSTLKFETTIGHTWWQFCGGGRLRKSCFYLHTCPSKLLKLHKCFWINPILMDFCQRKKWTFLVTSLIWIKKIRQ